LFHKKNIVVISFLLTFRENPGQFGECQCLIFQFCPFFETQNLDTMIVFSQNPKKPGHAFFISHQTQNEPEKR